MLFRTPSHAAKPILPPAGDFGYLAEDACYLDSACQTLRPQCVIDAETQYYHGFNACGGRVKYAWGTKVDDAVREARRTLLAFAGKRAPEYWVAFTMNTTCGINAVLHQLGEGMFPRIVTSEIEHNSVLLPSMTWASRRGAERLVLPRDAHGNLTYTPSQLAQAVVLINAMSNIDGRVAGNLPDIARDAHRAGGILLVDGAQSFGHDPELLRRTDFDAAFGSGHKMYGPSIGFIVIKRELLQRLDPFFLGGGTVTDVTVTGYALLREGDEAHAVLEPGLQNWAGIIGLKAAVEWLEKRRSDGDTNPPLAAQLFSGLQEMPRVHLLNRSPSPIISLHVDGIDAHQLSLYLSQRNIMCRSGHFCCHAYLQHQLALPPLLRVSLGLHNTPEHIQRFLDALRIIITTL